MVPHLFENYCLLDFFTELFSLWYERLFTWILEYSAVIVAENPLLIIWNHSLGPGLSNEVSAESRIFWLIEFESKTRFIHNLLIFGWHPFTPPHFRTESPFSPCQNSAIFAQFLFPLPQIRPIVNCTPQLTVTLGEIWLWGEMDFYRGENALGEIHFESRRKWI